MKEPALKRKMLPLMGTILFLLLLAIALPACAPQQAPPPAEEEAPAAPEALALEFDPAWYQTDIAAYGGDRFYIEDGVLYADGYNFIYPISAELPEGEFYERIEVAQNAIHVDIAVANGNVLYLDDQQRLYVWGPNNNGLLLEDPTHEQRLNEHLCTAYQPQLVMEDVLYAVLGGGHILALKTDGSLWAWGLNANGELGDGSQGSERPYGTTFDIAPYSAQPLHIMDDVVYCLAFGYSSAALQADGTLWTWGDNSYGQIGNGARGYGMPTISDNIVPSPYLALTHVEWIWPEENWEIDNIYAQRSDGTVWAWGDDHGSTPAPLPGQEASAIILPPPPAPPVAETPPEADTRSPLTLEETVYQGITVGETTPEQLIELLGQPVEFTSPLPGHYAADSYDYDGYAFLAPPLIKDMIAMIIIDSPDAPAFARDIHIGDTLDEIKAKFPADYIVRHQEWFDEYYPRAELQKSVGGENFDTTLAFFIGLEQPEVYFTFDYDQELIFIQITATKQLTYDNLRQTESSLISRLEKLDEFLDRNVTGYHQPLDEPTRQRYEQMKAQMQDYLAVVRERLAALEESGE